MGTNREENIKEGLSRREALTLTRLASQGKTIITIKDIETAIESSYSEAKKVANNLVNKRWLDRLKSGTYLIVPLAAGEKGEYTEHEFVIASNLADDMYISYWTALNHHGLTEQVPMTVFAATTSRVPERRIHGVTYRFITLTESKYFGYQPVAINSHRVNVASVEKALVDCADHPEHCGGIAELSKALSNAEPNPETFVDYLLRIGNGAAVKRIVYLADLLEIELPDRERVEEAFTTGYSPLDPAREREGTYSKKYRLLLNVEEEELLGGAA